MPSTTSDLELLSALAKARAAYRALVAGCEWNPARILDVTAALNTVENEELALLARLQKAEAENVALRAVEVAARIAEGAMSDMHSEEKK